MLNGTLENIMLNGIKPKLNEKYLPFSHCISRFTDNNSYKFYKIKPPVLLFAIECVTLDYHVLL